jgi:hypothetical protein
MATAAGIIELEKTLIKPDYIMKRLILISFLTFAYMANAQEIISLKDAITYALENKSDAKKARLKVENSKYQIQEVRSRALPKITANGGLTYNPISNYLS